MKTNEFKQEFDKAFGGNHGNTLRLQD